VVNNQQNIERVRLCNCICSVVTEILAKMLTKMVTQMVTKIVNKMLTIILTKMTTKRPPLFCNGVKVVSLKMFVLLRSFNVIWIQNVNFPQKEFLIHANVF